MKGYFSQLLEQTGVIFGLSESIRQDDQLTGNPENPDQLHVEETEVIEYRHEPSGNNTSENLAPDIEEIIIEQQQDQKKQSSSNNLIPHIEKYEITESRQNQIRDGTPFIRKYEPEEKEQQQDQKKQSSSNNLIPHIEKYEITESRQDQIRGSTPLIQKYEPEKKEQQKEPDDEAIIFSDINNKKLPDRDQDFQIERILNKEKMIEADGNEYYQKPIRHAQQPDDELNRILIKNEHLKQVRKWVAGSTPDTEEIESHEGRLIQGKKEAKPQFIPVIPESEQKAEPDIQDFNLSIGTISLTIEEPQKEIQKKEPPQPAKVETRSSRESSSSRLSRHYIRII